MAKRIGQYFAERWQELLFLWIFSMCAGAAGATPLFLWFFNGVCKP
jgi:hypothetical protein